jgi:hypothetical protein
MDLHRAIPRASRRPDDPAPSLRETLTNLDVSERVNAPDYAINRLEFVQHTAGTASAELEAHRKRLQELLENARQIEEMLAQEAAQARALAESLQLDQKRAAAAQAAQAELAAGAEAQAIAQNTESAAAYQAKIDAELIAAQRELADAQNLVVISKSKVMECEAKSKEAAQRVNLAKSLTHDAECRVAKYREAREAAEAHVRQAEEIAGQIALTTETLKRLGEIGKAAR